MQKYNILELNEKLLPELQSIAEELGIKKVSSLKKEELVYRILDEQAISYAGIQAEKMKEKEAKKPVEGRKRGRPAKAASPKVAKAETAEAAESAQQASEKPVAAPADKKEQKEQPERKKRVRIEKKEKVAGAIAPSEDNKEVERAANDLYGNGNLGRGNSGGSREPGGETVVASCCGGT